MTSRLRESAGRRLVDAIVLPLERLRRVVDDQLPLGSSEEAVDYVLAHASGFSVASVLEYCGGDERQSGELVDDVRRLLETVSGRVG